MSLPPPARRAPRWGHAPSRPRSDRERPADAAVSLTSGAARSADEQADLAQEQADLVQGTGSEAGSAGRAKGLPGGRVVTVAALIVIAVAAVEVRSADRIGTWTGITLVVVSVIAALVTRAGDRSLPAMMPPLAFLAAILTAGQALLPENGASIWAREAVLIAETLGSNAVWVVAATVLASMIGLIRRGR